MELPPDLEALVELNRHKDKGEVARVKILLRYLHDRENIQEFLEMRLRVLPHTISWLGKDWPGLPRARGTRLRRPYISC